MRRSGLNPFGSGTFFIPRPNTVEAGLTGLNPFDSGTFFIRELVNVLDEEF